MATWASTRRCAIRPIWACSRRSDQMSPRHKSIETQHYEERDSFFGDLWRLGTFSRRGFLKVAGTSAAIAAAKGLVTPHSFQIVDVAQAAESGREPFRFAYVSDTHLYT